jgi:hypothetical protein
MLTSQHEVIVRFVPYATGALPDPYFDFAAPEMDGFFTWNTLPPTGAQIVFSFEADAANQVHSVAFVERVISYSEKHLTKDRAIEMSRKFHNGIKDAVQKHGYPIYVHSMSYEDSMRQLNAGALASDVQDDLRDGRM